MDKTLTHRASARIFNFPQRLGTFAGAARAAGVKLSESERRHGEIATAGECWYHEAALQEADRKRGA